MIRFRRAMAVACALACVATSAPVLAQPINPSDSEIAQANGEVATAETNVASLISTISQSDAEIAELEMRMGGLREAVNKALVDLHDAQTNAEQARQGVTTARGKLDVTQQSIVEAQQTLDEISRTTYRRGSTTVVDGVSGKETSEDSLDRQTYLRTNAAKQRKIIEELDRLRTQQANEESMLREARNIAEKREEEANQAQTAAQNAIEANSAELNRRQAEHSALISERDTAQSRLNQARGTAATLEGQRKEFEEYQAAEDARKAAEAEAAKAEEARKAAEAQAAEKAAAQAAAEAEAVKAAEAEAAAQEESEREAAAQRRLAAEEQARMASEEAQAAETVLITESNNAQAAAQTNQNANDAAQVAAAALIAATQPDHANVEDPGTLNAIQNPNASGDNGTSTNLVDELFVSLENLDSVSQQASSQLGNADRSAKIEAVIARASSQIGTPYAWGGGDANGPTRGIRDGGVADSHGDYNKIGFDCSGLVLYAFAGVGIALPHYTGYQYQRGTKISPQEIQRGDLIFYGPNAEHHVAIYLGDGTMLEAPQSGSTVKISPVRWSGMSPHAVRLI